MSQHPLFEVSPEQVAALDDEGLRLLIARLCQADLRRRGLPVGAVLYGGNQIAADGGIDVRVELPADTDILGFIPRPATGFQAKADDMPASEIEKAMRPKAEQPDGTKAGRLRPSIRALAEAGGAYVIVSSKGSTTDSRLTERRDAMRAAVADLSRGDALHLDFYDRTRVATWIREYPGEVMWLRNRIGQPLDPADAVYVDIGHDAPEPSVGQLTHQLIAEGKRAILLLDNCPRETHDATAPVCKEEGSQISLITVDLDIRDEKPEDTDAFRLQSASEAVIESLLERRYPALSQAVRRRIAEFSDGNARIAILIAQNVDPEANLADLGDEGLFERLFCQRMHADDQLLRAAEALALVYSFDGETFTGDGAELPFISRLAGLEWREVLRAVGELKRRDIVQSRGRWRAILPQPLANWLAKRALQNLSPLEVADAFWGCANPRILKSFTHRLSYLHDAPEAEQIGTAWLRPGGPLSDLRAITWSSMDQRIDLVRHLAPVVPNAILDLIERFVLDSEPDQLKTRECPKRQVLMSLLRKLAWFPEHFCRAASAARPYC